MPSHNLFETKLLEPPVGHRRILALVLPELLCELIEQRLIAHDDTESPSPTRKSRQASGHGPFAVVLAEKGLGSRQEEASEGEKIALSLRAKAPLLAVNSEAKRLGIREGHTIAEARATVAGLKLFQLSEEKLLEALGKLAEVMMDLGPLVSISAPNTLWVDITGSSHLKGGEASLLIEAVERLQSMGHRARAAIASGPWLSQAFARWFPLDPQGKQNLFSSKNTVAKLSELPLSMLPLDVDQVAFFAKLGVLNIAQLRALPSASVSSRLGARAHEVMQLAWGKDTAPLSPYRPAQVLAEEVGFLEPISGVEPLLFVLRGLLSRLSNRLIGRGEAAERLKLGLWQERVPGATEVDFVLPTPLFRDLELLRVLRSKVERLKLSGLIKSVRIEASKLVPAPTRQLDFSAVVSGVTTRAFDESEFSVLLAELYADIGKENVGVLRLLDAHRPEAKSGLFAAKAQEPGVRRASKRAGRSRMRDRNAPSSPWKAERTEMALEAQRSTASVPTRLWPSPIRIESAFRAGEIIGIGSNLYEIERVVFDHRLDGVEWWSKLPVSRDYVRLWLKGSSTKMAVLGYINRDSGSRFIQGVYD